MNTHRAMSSKNGRVGFIKSKLQISIVCKMNSSPILLLALLAGLCVPTVLAAENLHMRPGISFAHDLDQGFPIMGDKMDDVQIASGKPTVLFFGAAGDLN